MTTQANYGLRPRRGELVMPLILVVLTILSFAAFCGCGLNEFAQQTAKLKPLQARRAPKSEIIQLLGTNFLFYKKGETNWQYLTNYLSSEPSNRNVAVRKYSKTWPNVMLYSTPDMMTWIFLDDTDRISQFVIGAQ